MEKNYTQIVSKIHHNYTYNVIQHYRYLQSDGVAVSTFENLANEKSLGIELFVNHNVVVQL